MHPPERVALLPATTTVSVGAPSSAFWPSVEPWTVVAAIGVAVAVAVTVAVLAGMLSASNPSAEDEEPTTGEVVDRVLRRRTLRATHAIPDEDGREPGG